MSLAAALLLSLAEIEDLPGELTLDPQGTRRPAAGFFGRAELALFAGATVFGSDFEADPSFDAGGWFRLPAPGLPTGKVGLFAEYMISSMDRDLEDFRENTDGMFHVFAVGGDYPIVSQPTWFVRAQAGAVYMTFGDITGVDDGWGAVGGLALGIHWIKGDTGTAFLVNPQLAYDGDDYVLFFNVGLSFRL